MEWPAIRISGTSKKSLGMYVPAVMLQRQGVDVIHLEVGRPNFDTPKHIKEATKKALDAGVVHYGDPAGNEDFREAIAAKLQRENGIPAAADEIIVTNGLTHAAYMTCMAALNPGDEVIAMEPYYPQHRNKIELAGGKVVPVSLDKERNFAVDGPAIRRQISSNTRMISVVNPVNPTGRVYSPAELETIAAIAIEYDLLVMSDEVYEKIVFDGNRHVSLASLPGMAERTITHFAFTKAYAMDGWRLGYLAAPRRFIDALLKISLNDVTHVNVFIQEGGRAAIEGDQDSLEAMVAEDCRRRDLVCARLNDMRGVRCAIPEGTIYAFPDVSGVGVPDDRLAAEILQATHVGVEAGSFYGSAGAGHLRLCFGSEPYDRIEAAMERLDDFLNGIRTRKVSG